MWQSLTCITDIFLFNYIILKFIEWWTVTMYIYWINVFVIMFLFTLHVCDSSTVQNEILYRKYDQNNFIVKMNFN